MATLPVELLQTVCPCGCRAPVLVRADQLPAGVTCPTGQRRYALPAGKPLKARFGRKQWDACHDIRLLRQALQLLGARPSARKRRLAACAVAVACLDWCKNGWFRAAVAAGQEIAEAGTTARDCLEIIDLLSPVTMTWEQVGTWRVVGVRCLEVEPPLQYGEVEALDPRRVAAAVREVLGNPFRPPVVDPAWLTDTVVGLAAAIHAGKNFHDLPILADALEEAGCPDRPMLDHLRAETPHAVGCWVLDAVRGRA